MRSTLIPIILLLCLATAHAASDHITLLTVSDEEGMTGGTADLYLTMRQGTGAIYIDSFPLTRVDTQGSVRYANQIACDLLQADCSRYDFLYTIRANSAIVGGPSAGGAITVLTVAVLDNKELDQKTAMTGTINSGGIIGPVAGVSAKVRGAKSAGMTTVLIPSLSGESRNASNETNRTIEQLPLMEGKDEQLSDNDIDVYRVSTVEDALLIFTGKNYSQELPPLQLPQEYLVRMRAIAEEICNRSDALQAQFEAKGSSYNDSNNYTKRINALAEDHLYSRASLCFSKNIELSSLLLQNTSNATRETLYRSLRTTARELDERTRNQTIDTIGDLETYAIVKERIIEAQTLLDSDTAQESRNLAYARERLVSARSWSRFFGMPGREVQIDSEYLRQACLAKLGEADERINYVRLYAPEIVGEAESMQTQAQSYSSNEPILCIFTASKAKAQANVIANAISIDQENVDALLQQKLDADVRILQKQQQKEFFPIIGTSYTQYAADLRVSTPYNALIFSEYALELSNIDIYFPKPRSIRLPQGLTSAALLFGLGALFGLGIGLFFLGRKMNKTETKKVVKRKR